MLLSTVNVDSRHFQFLMKAVVTSHVPDYLYSSHVELAERLPLFEFVDAYFTTNQDLHQLYRDDPLLPAPASIIYDWPHLPEPEAINKTAVDEPLTVMWSGNSKWGEYAGYGDYKGLKGVIEPALAQLKERGFTLRFLCMDSSTKRVEHKEILRQLEQTDVLLIASEEEGTPLTLIEAMSRGCAVISTDVGIVSEVLPESSQALICPRTEDDFAEALQGLITNRDALAHIQADNLQAYHAHFGEQSPLREAWLQFFNGAYENSLQSGYERKRAAIYDTSGALRRWLVSSARRSALLAKRWGVVDTLNGLSPLFAQAYGRIIHGAGRHKKLSYQKMAKVYQRLVQQLDPTQPVVMYAPMWKGVAASTESLFTGNLIRFPYFDSEFPEVANHEYLSQLVELLTEHAATKPIIYSGGSLLHLSVAKAVREKNKSAKQLFMWHGSPAQFVESSQYAHFTLWRKAYDRGIIDGFISVKPELHRTLGRMGIRAFNFYNPIPPVPTFVASRATRGKRVQVGLFSAMNSWYKNPDVQLLALAGRRDIALHTTLDRSSVESMRMKIGKIHFYDHMPRRKFLSVLAQQDVVLYVTNTECSPMTALESWAFNIPCIVGPAGDIYSACSPRLAELLVEPQVDNPTAISQRLDLVLQHKEEIRQLLSEHRQTYNQGFERERDQLVQKLFSFTPTKRRRPKEQTADKPGFKTKALPVENSVEP